MFSYAHICSKKIDVLRTVWVELHNPLNAKRATAEQHSSCTVILIIASELYPMDKDRTSTIKICIEIVSAGHCKRCRTSFFEAQNAQQAQ